MSHCQFGSSSNIFIGINAKSGPTTNYDKIYMYKFILATAKFVNGKMLSVTNSIGSPLIILKTMIVSSLNGDQFYGGEIKS
jgi:hypothetical protein